MNIYELIGRLLLLHQYCEDLFASCGNSLDKIIAKAKMENDKKDALSDLFEMSKRLEEIKTELGRYSEIINDELANEMINDSK